MDLICTEDCFPPLSEPLRNELPITGTSGDTVGELACKIIHYLAAFKIVYYIDADHKTDKLQMQEPAMQASAYAIYKDKIRLSRIDRVGKQNDLQRKLLSSECDKLTDVRLILFLLKNSTARLPEYPGSELKITDIDQ